MNKKEFIKSVAEQTGLTQDKADEVVKAVFATIQEAITSKKKVSIPGFGSFETTKRAAREGRNPSTGAVIKIPASNQPKFKPSKALKDAANAA